MGLLFSGDSNMALSRRFIASFISFVVFMLFATFYFPHSQFTIPAAILIFVWKTWRDYYLSRWEVHLEEDGLRQIIRPTFWGEAEEQKAPWGEICRVQRLGFPARAVLFHWRENPETVRYQGDVEYRLPVMRGMEWPNVRRRVLTLSDDVLLQCLNGLGLLIPIGSLDGRQRRELWTTLHIHIPHRAFESNSQLIKQAFSREEAGNELFIDHQWQQAYEAFHQAADLWQQAGHIDCQARCLHHITVCLLRAGRFSEARDLGEKNLAFGRNLGDLRKQALALNGLAEVDWKIGGARDLNKGLERLEEAATLYKVVQDTVAVAKMKGCQALHCEKMFLLKDDRQEKQNYLEKAERYIEEGLAELHHAQGKWPDFEIAMRKANLIGIKASLAFHQRDWRTAAAFFLESYELSQGKKRVIVDDLSMWGFSLFKVWRQGSNSEPSSTLHQALEKLKTAVSLCFLHGDYAERLLCYFLRGSAFMEMGNLQASAQDFKEVIGVLEGGRVNLLRDFERVSLLRQYAYVYGDLVETLLRMAEKEPEKSSDLIRDAFHYCELGKARSLFDLLREDSIPLAAPPREQADFLEAQQKFRETQLEIEWLQKSTYLEADDSKSLDTAWEKCRRAETAFNARRQEMAQYDPLSASTASPTAAVLSDLQASLPTDKPTAILEFSVGEKALGIFLILKDRPAEKTSFYLEGLGRQNLEHTIRHAWLDPYRQATGPEMAVCLAKALPSFLDTIRSQILSVSGLLGLSITESLKRQGIKRLVIVPHGILHLVPFHAALLSEPDLQDLEISYAPSAAILLKTVRHSSEAPTEILLINNPTRDLQYAKLEVDQIKPLFREASIKILEHEKANKETVIANLSRYSWLHFACHAQSNLVNPLDSELALAGKESLSVKTILAQGRMLKGSWAVLSACETGIAPPDLAGEYVGLPSAFLAMGARVVVCSLWPVQDLATALLMGRFYENIRKGGLTPPESLREAQLYLRGLTPSEFQHLSQTQWPQGSRELLVVPKGKGRPDTLTPEHPYLWAPFIVCGAAW
jgi:CHAT domain-containing protein